MKRLLETKTIKVALSSTIAIVISNYLGLQFAVTSGIIAILSIQDTKKEALIVGGRRLLAAILAILLSFLLYLLLGNSPLIFGIFLFIFIPIVKKFNIVEGMAVGPVLSTHLLISENIGFHWILNECILTLIGIGVALIFNFLTRSLEEEFEKNKRHIEDIYKVILLDMAESLLNQAVPIYQQKVFDEVEMLIKETKKMAHIIRNNNIFKTYSYHEEYMNMRINQFEIINRMKKHFYRFYMTFHQTELLSTFTRDVSKNINEDNDCVKLLDQLDNLKKDFANMDLPRSRDEFENRALLYQFLNDLEDFLKVKRKYVLLSNANRNGRG